MFECRHVHTDIPPCGHMYGWPTLLYLHGLLINLANLEWIKFWRFVFWDALGNPLEDLTRQSDFCEDGPLVLAFNNLDDEAPGSLLQFAHKKNQQRARSNRRRMAMGRPSPNVEWGPFHFSLFPKKLANTCLFWKTRLASENRRMTNSEQKDCCKCSGAWQGWVSGLGFQHEHLIWFAFTLLNYSLVCISCMPSCRQLNDRFKWWKEESRRSSEPSRNRRWMIKVSGA